MSRKHKHEEHTNHEAWAIPYGDLVTLLLAFFVVMYAISTVNEGKYRAVSDSLSAAFKNSPRSIAPIQVGDKNPSAIQESGPPLDAEGNLIGSQTSLIASGNAPDVEDQTESEMSPMDKVIQNVEATMADLIQKDMLVIHRKSYGVEIELRTDILFPSGSATMSPVATGVLQQLAETLKPLPYPMRVEGHTDNRPINTVAFRSNWELSAARAATVVHLFMERGVDPSRMAVIGLGEFRPVADNVTEDGRNKNRRVMVVILNNADAVKDEAPDSQNVQDVAPALVAAPIVPPIDVIAGAAVAAPVSLH